MRCLNCCCMQADPELQRLVRERYGLSMDVVCCDAWAIHNGHKELIVGMRLGCMRGVVRSCQCAG